MCLLSLNLWHATKIQISIFTLQKTISNLFACNLTAEAMKLVCLIWSADVLSGRHIVRCFLDILSGPSSDILSGLLGSAPDILSGRLRIRHIVRRTFCQDWMDLHQTNCQDVYVDQSIFLVYWPYFWYVYDQISQFQPNFTILTKFHNFDQIS